MPRTRGGEGIAAAARLGLEKLAGRVEFLTFIMESLGAADGVSPQCALAVLAAGGQAAVRVAVEKLAETENPAVRKKLILLLARLGDWLLPRSCRYWTTAAGVLSKA